MLRQESGLEVRRQVSVYRDLPAVTCSQKWIPDGRAFLDPGYPFPARAKPCRSPHSLLHPTLHNCSTLHNKLHILQSLHIAEWISVDRNQISEVAFTNLAYFVSPPE